MPSSPNFADLIQWHLKKKAGLTRAKMARALNCEPPEVTKLVGRSSDEEESKGPKKPIGRTRERVLQIIEWLLDEEVLDNFREANDLMCAADPDFRRLDPGQPDNCTEQEARLVERLLLAGSHSHLPPCPDLNGIVGRDDDMTRLKALLGIGGGGIQLITSVHGWPGVGKTTLAAMLAYDKDLRRTFPDGILWTSLGTQPNVLVELTAWVHALKADRILSDVTRPGDLSRQLRQRLQDKRMLLIVDDVWDATLVQHFWIGGPGCALVVTTREQKVADDLADPRSVYHLGVLSEEHALKLLETEAPGVVADYPDASRELVHALECLPLALRVAGSLLRTEAEVSGWRVPTLLQELRTQTAILEAEAPVDVEMNDPISRSRPSVRALLRKSTDRLDNLRGCFIDLAWFAPKPAIFDLDALQVLWGVKKVDASEIVKKLVQRGLIEPVSEKGHRYQIHALLVAHARELGQEASR